MTGDDELERSEIEAVLETRRELGRQYDAALVDGFADRIERAVDQRVAAELADRGRSSRSQDSAGARQLALGIVSTVAGIPITAITIVPGDAGLPGLLVVWGGLVGINWAHAVQSRR